jgi:hypothetical protein
VVSFTPLLLYPWGKNHGTHWTGGWVGPRAGLDHVVKRKFLLLLGFKLHNPACRQLLYWLSSPSFSTVLNTNRKIYEMMVKYF